MFTMITGYLQNQRKPDVILYMTEESLKLHCVYKTI